MTTLDFSLSDFDLKKDHKILSYLIEHMKKKGLRYFHLPIGTYQLGEEITVNLVESLEILKHKPKKEESSEQRYQLITYSNLIGEGAEGKIFQSNLYAKENEKGELYEIKISKKKLKFIFNSEHINIPKMIEKMTADSIANNEPLGKSRFVLFTPSDTKNYYGAFIQPFFNGENLGDLIKKDQLTLENQLAFEYKLKTAVNLGKKIILFHENLNKVHNDLKPENILVNPEGEVHLIDSAPLSIGEPYIEITGTLDYMPPEKKDRVALLEKKNQSLTIIQESQERLEKFKHNEVISPLMKKKTTQKLTEEISYQTTDLNEIVEVLNKTTLIADKRHDYYAYGKILEELFPEKPFDPNRKNLIQKTVQQLTHKDINQRPSDLNQIIVQLEELLETLLNHPHLQARL